MTNDIRPAIPSERVALTTPLVNWLADDRGWPSMRWRDRAFLRWQGAMGTVNARLSGLTGPGSEGRDSIEGRPLVLIVGPWRSGTTALHETLVAASAWTTPRTWQCLAAPTFRLVPQRDAATRHRPMDDMPVTPNSPQEDEFALLSLGVPSVYRGFLMPHRIRELTRLLSQEYWLQHPEWQNDWQRFLEAVASNGPLDSPLLLKSPNHTFRLESILIGHPGARLIWCARAPREILASNLRMWRAMASAYGMTRMDEVALMEFLVEALTQSAIALEICTRRLPPHQLAIVHSSTLRRDPAAVMHAIAAWAAEDARCAFTPASGSGAQSARISAPAPFEIPASCEAAVAALDAAQRDALARFGLPGAV